MAKNDREKRAERAERRNGGSAVASPVKGGTSKGVTTPKAAQPAKQPTYNPPVYNQPGDYGSWGSVAVRTDPTRGDFSANDGKFTGSSDNNRSVGDAVKERVTRTPVASDPTGGTRQPDVLRDGNPRGHGTGKPGLPAGARPTAPGLPAGGSKAKRGNAHLVRNQVFGPAMWSGRTDSYRGPTRPDTNLRIDPMVKGHDPHLQKPKPARSSVDKTAPDNRLCKAKDRPTDNRPKGGSGSGKKFVPWKQAGLC